MSTKGTKLTPLKDAEVRQNIYMRMAEMTHNVDLRFIKEYGQKIRERDILRYKNYSVCLQENAGSPQQLKECGDHLSSISIESDKVNKKLQEAKDKMYSCVETKYSNFDLSSKREEDRPEICLPEFEKDVFKSLNY